MTAIQKDVIIAGGGLAGLSLARQLKNAQPELDILVLERNQFPVPEKTAKVGESTVEIGSRYLNHTLGLKQHFDTRHLRKHGLRCFFGEPQKDFADQDELGVSQLFGIPTYQIDRGAIENYLQKSVSDDGVQVADGAITENIKFTDKAKLVTAQVDGQSKTFSAPWLVDAAGRQALIKSKLGLAMDNQHKGNAVWFRIDRQVKLDQWSANQQWQERIVEPQTRWLSTNHLMGPGYWVWIIPLDNGATSIGIVMDDVVFESADFSNIEGAKSWLRQHQPHCADAIDGAPVLDYVAIRDYSHGCKQLFSDQGWGLSGESGVFADPFYSPGSDFIAFNNTFISDLVSDSFSGQDIRLKSLVFQNINQSFFDSTMSLYTGQYGGFGDRRMMSLKLVWDYAYYWGVLSVLFFKSALTDVDLMREMSTHLQSAQASNQAVQGAFRERAKQRLVLPAGGLFMNQYEVPCLKHFNRMLDNDSISVQQALPDNADKLKRLSQHIIALLNDTQSASICADEQALLGDYRRYVLA